MKIINEVFPVRRMIGINMGLKERIKKLKDDYSSDFGMSPIKGVNDPCALEDEVLKNVVEEEKHRKEILEEKGKIQVAGITIAITVVLGTAGNLNRIAHYQPALRWIAFAILLYIVVNLALSGLLPINMLINENMVHYVPIDVDQYKKDKRIELYCSAISKNRLCNSIRNNYIATSYCCIRNAIIALTLLLIIWSLPI